MPAPFEQYRARALGAIDGVMAESVELLFLRSGKSDPSRQNLTIKAVLHVGAGKSASPSDGQAWQSWLAAGEAELRITRATYDGPQIKKGDVVKALAREGTPMWEVRDVHDRKPGRLTLSLGAV